MMIISLYLCLIIIYVSGAKTLMTDGRTDEEMPVKESATLLVAGLGLQTEILKRLSMQKNRTSAPAAVP